MNNELGNRLKAYRKRARMTLKDLADKTELSSSFLSKVESGQVGISVSNLDRISAALSVDITYLVKGNKNATLPAVTVEGSRPIFALQGDVLYEALAPILENFDINATRVTSQPSQNSGEPTQHVGDEFRYILNGQFRFWVGNEELDLGPGDTLCHSANMPHRWENIGDEPGAFIVVSTMPWH